MEKFQSGFRENHSTETVLTKVVSSLRISTDANKVSVLVLLDISVVFDTVDHNILIEHLKNWAGLSGTVLNWFHSYIFGRKFFVKFFGNMNTI